VVPAVNGARLRKEPLVHFLLAGGAMFALAALWGGGGDEAGRDIRVGREDLLVFMQGRAQVYDDRTFAALLDDMPAEERRRLVRDTALQEALYREGQSLALAEADPLIRQRIVQQMRLLLMEEAAADLRVSEAEVQDYYSRNRAQYALPSGITFTHVFFAGEGSRRKAQAMLDRLRAEKVPLSKASEFGERFLYQLNYSEASSQLVSSHFGEHFAQAAFALHPGVWQGPVQSQYGWHLVLPVAVQPEREPIFADISEQVRADALAEKRQNAADGALDRLLARYEVKVEDGVGS